MSGLSCLSRRAINTSGPLTTHWVLVVSCVGSDCSDWASHPSPWRHRTGQPGGSLDPLIIKDQEQQAFIKPNSLFIHTSPLWKESFYQSFLVAYSNSSSHPHWSVCPSVCMYVCLSPPFLSHLMSQDISGYPGVPWDILQSWNIFMYWNIFRHKVFEPFQILEKWLL